MTDSTERPEIWSVILAAGKGEENRPFVQRWLFSQNPRQYYSLVGNKSIFQQTLDRAELLSPPECRVTVIAAQHYLEALLQVGVRRPGKLVAEPFHRDTAAELFLGVAHVYAHNPQATVVLLPCDHFVYPQNQFVRAAKAGIRVANLLTDHLILLAVSPDGIVPTHGSIQPGREYGWIADYCVRSVEAFRGKLNSGETGLLSNTSILVAKAETLWKIGSCSLPEIMCPLERYRSAIGTDREQAVLEEIYQTIPSRNFFTHVLQSFPQRAAVIEMNGVLSCDWRGLKRMAAMVQQVEESSRSVA